MTCPFCGAANVEYYSHTGFECVSWTVCNNFEQSATCRELCQLREKKAEGLTWQAIGHTLQADYCQGVFVIDLPGKGNDYNYYLYSQKSPMSGSIFDYADHKDPLDAAKAHAEELHQQAWRELRNKWDAK